MVSEKSRAGSAADLTRDYVDDHPSIRAVLRDDLLNFTALARLIQSEREVRNEEAVTIACRRYQRELARDAPETHAIRSVLAASRIEVHTDVALVRVREDAETLDRLLSIVRRTVSSRSERPVFEVYQGTRATTVLCDERLLASLLPEVPARLRVAVERGLAIISFRSRPEVNEIPGVVAHLAEALYRRGVNCLETVSVHTDSIFVFPHSDVIRAFQILSELIPAAAMPPSIAKRA